MENSDRMNEVLKMSINLASKMHHEYILPEHLLLSLLEFEEAQKVLYLCGIDAEKLRQAVKDWLEGQDKAPAMFALPVPSVQFSEMMKTALKTAHKNNDNCIDIKDYVIAILCLNESEAAYLLGTAIEGKEQQVVTMLHETDAQGRNGIEEGLDNAIDEGEERQEYGNVQQDGRQMQSVDWRSLVTNISYEAKSHTPLIGREKELERTIQVLCRMEKNNVLHIGDPGVGKTALIYGLAKLISENKVPLRLRDYTIYSMNIGELIAGTQFRGDFEKKLKLIMDGAKKHKVILYLDEIHCIMGAGAGDNGVDASNFLKPYLTNANLRFIGATTHEDFNRKMAKDKAITRRFQMIEINEPTVDEAIKILYGLQKPLQNFHKVTIRKDVLEYAVRAAAKYISGRCLPDKAIDLVDEAGAYMEVMRGESYERCYVTKAVIDEVLIKVRNIQASVLKDDNNESLKDLRYNILSKIYGQNEAVDEVTEAVMMAKAGLSDEEKPMASFLFVGPTGVGKTEVAKVLAAELGIELVRFDMSEYTEKHTVAKLIGSPAGYVGYEDGGLLTAAIRKSPNCVLLLDEIEKAHSDIYNILLQVMDYARLTDNRGQKADFRNVILIMTSNAGAQYAAQAGIGFTGGISKGEAMMKQVKKTFKPEFINRLSNIVVFNEMDERMAGMIFSKKLEELKEKVSAKGLTLKLSKEAFLKLLKKSFSKEYGAREFDRVITHELKPLVMREILFGKKKKGETIEIGIVKNSLAVTNSKYMTVDETPSMFD